MKKHSESQRSRSRRVGKVLACVLGLVSFSLCGAQTTQRQGNANESVPGGGQPYNAITVVPSTHVVMESDTSPAKLNDRTSAVKPINKYAEFSIMVQSGLPDWGVAIEAISLVGPNGEVPLDRLLVKTDLTGGEFRSLASRSPVLTGDYRLPVRESKIVIAFDPSWEDPAGVYVGKVILRPFVPEDQNMSIPSPGKFPGFIANDQEVQLSFNNDESIMIEQPGEEIAFELHTTSSGQEAVAELPFSVSTNAGRWRVVCEPTFLEGGRQKISPSRIDWNRLDEYGRVVQSGNLESDVAVLEGFGPVQGLSSRLRLTLPLSPSDIAGSYVGRLTFIGVFDGARKERVEEKKITIPNSGE